jgi:hypothetical protein
MKDWYNSVNSVGGLWYKYLQSVSHSVANTCDSIVSSQTITKFKHVIIPFEPFTNKFDIITCQAVTNPVILYSIIEGDQNVI